jgi:hypothetical protein
MRTQNHYGRLKAILLTLLLLHPGQQGWRALAALTAAAGIATSIATEVMAQRRSSGGYSRPGGYGGGYSRLPSTGGARVAPRTPSTDSYGLPGGGSTWDRGQARRRSGDALEQYRRQQAPQQAPGTPDADVPWWRRGGTLGSSRAPARTGGWYRDRGWSLPGGYPGIGQRSFGIWDGLFLWFLLNNLSRPGATEFFHNHRDDPGFRDWRAEVEQRAQEDPEVRQRLEELDRELAQREGQPRDPNFLPPDVPPEVALAPQRDLRTPPVEQEAEGFGHSATLVLLGGGFLLAVLMMRRMRGAAPGGGPLPVPAGGAPPPPPRPVPDLGGKPGMAPPALRPAGAGTRVGMLLTLDPAPFLLAKDSTKVPPPQAGAGGEEMRLSVEAVGRIPGPEGAELRRLYLPGGEAMVELHLDGKGQVEAARYFATIDEVAPADPEEWQVWLDPREGMIGWPEFQTKDGKLYARAWSPGSEPVPPILLDEMVEVLGGVRQKRSQAMLYAAPTGARPPAPETEYILVSAIQEGNAAWVEIHAGIDINPASLSLP